MVITDQELEALQGLPLGAQVLYLREIRRYMDFSTGVTGISRRISWQGLREVLEVEPRPGVARELPSKDQVRRLAGWLERAGLVRNISDMSGRQLIFRLPLAMSDWSIQIKAATNPSQTRHIEATTNPPRVEANNGAGLVGMDMDNPPDMDEGEMGDNPPDIRYPFSVDFDDDTCASAWDGVRGWPAVKHPNSQPGASVAVVALFRGLLGEEAMPSRQLMEACGTVATVAQVRPVTEVELKAAIQAARGRGATCVASYAARIIENGSMVEGKPRRPKGSNGGEDAAMLYLRGEYGECA
ncbi:hypothetical protein LQD23_21410 [Chromobacterium violaceum]|uniref:hypothetical protein n=1 Tax=Chromobacterium violaceum TaxID=536 RepID=UPI001E2A4C37|nr:hypothetical protein [Chromobacterium violaceum]MCD0494837.1 hypothetical protein [Chromobacterium violaceum]